MQRNNKEALNFVHLERQMRLTPCFTSDFNNSSCMSGALKFDGVILISSPL